MKWWVIAIVVVAIAWWVAHCHLMSRLRRLARRGLLGGCSPVASQTSEESSFMQAGGGQVPTNVGGGGPASLPATLPNGDDTHYGCGCQA